MIKLAITIGDPAGIGPEIVYKTLKRTPLPKTVKITIVGQKKCFWNQGYKVERLKGIEFLEISVIKGKDIPLGRENKLCGLAGYRYFHASLNLIKRNLADGLVTAPLDKKAVNMAGVGFQGHTEELERYFKKKTVMLMSSPEIRVSLFTRHLPLSRVASRIKESSLKEHIEILRSSLIRLYGISNPSLGICGFNPHAGEGGLFGDEEKRILRVVKTLKDPLVKGPFPADTLFLKRKEFDCFVGLYHDQAMIPFKLLSFRKGANVTLGLDFVRTSPPHGVALDIAGKNTADFRPFKYALLEAIKLVRNIKKHK